MAGQHRSPGADSRKATPLQQFPRLRIPLSAVTTTALLGTGMTPIIAAPSAPHADPAGRKAAEAPVERLIVEYEKKAQEAKSDAEAKKDAEGKGRKTGENLAFERRLGTGAALLQTTDSMQEPDGQQGHVVIRRLRDRELARRRLFRLMSSPSTEAALTGQVRWWARLFVLVLVPLIWFRLWRFIGQEYRWLLTRRPRTDQQVDDQRIPRGTACGPSTAGLVAPSACRGTSPHGLLHGLAAGCRSQQRRP